MDANFIHMNIMKKADITKTASLDTRLSNVIEHAEEDLPKHDTNIEKVAAISLLFDMFINYKG